MTNELIGEQSSCLLTVIIPTCDRPMQLMKALKSCKENQITGVEVVVVDDGKKFPVDPAMFGGLANVIKTTGYRGAAVARNIGALNANTDFLLFLDDDDRFAENYISEVLENIKIGKFDIGVCCTSQKEHKLLKLGHSQTSTSLPLKSCIFGAGMGFWVRRKMFLDIGGFSEKHIIDEDTHFFCKMRSKGIDVHVSSTVGILIAPELAPASESARLTHLGDTKLKLDAYAKTFIAFHRDQNLSYADKFFLLSRFIRAARQHYAQLFFLKLRTLVLG